MFNGKDPGIDYSTLENSLNAAIEHVQKNNETTRNKKIFQKKGTAIPVIRRSASISSQMSSKGSRLTPQRKKSLSLLRKSTENMRSTGALGSESEETGSGDDDSSAPLHYKSIPRNRMDREKRNTVASRDLKRRSGSPQRSPSLALPPSNSVKERGTSLSGHMPLTTEKEDPKFTPKLFRNADNGCSKAPTFGIGAHAAEALSDAGAGYDGGDSVDFSDPVNRVLYHQAQAIQLSGNFTPEQ